MLAAGGRTALVTTHREAEASILNKNKLFCLYYIRYTGLSFGKDRLSGSVGRIPKFFMILPLDQAFPPASSRHLPKQQHPPLLGHPSLEFEASSIRHASPA